MVNTWDEGACLFFICLHYLVLCNQLSQNLRLKTTTIYFSHDFAGQQFGLVSGGQLFLSRPHHSYICCQLEGNSWGWLVYDVLSGKAGIDEVSLMCYSPAGSSGLVRRASELRRQSQAASLMHKQFARRLSLMFATVTLTKANFKDTYIQGVRKSPSLNRRSYKAIFWDQRYRERKNIFIIYHNSPQRSGTR